MDFFKFNDNIKDIQQQLQQKFTSTDESLFYWLDTYKHKDLLVIDRSIADGSSSLKQRESKFREELEKRESQYIIYKNYRIYTATWNVNGKSPNDIYLNEWLSNSNDDDDEPPHIYAIAFQELDLSPKAVTMFEHRPDAVWMYEFHLILFFYIT